MESISSTVSLVIAVSGSILGAGWFWRWFTIRNENKKLSSDIDAQQAAIENQRAQTDAFIRAEMQKMFDAYKVEAEARILRLVKRLEAVEETSGTQQAEIVALEQKLAEQEDAHTVEIKTLTARIKELERLLNDERERREKVERENASLRRENGQLKKRGRGKSGL